MSVVRRRGVLFGVVGRRGRGWEGRGKVVGWNWEWYWYWNWGWWSVCKGEGLGPRVRRRLWRLMFYKRLLEVKVLLRKS